MQAVLKAIEMATIAHGPMKRKYSNEPYIIHPVRVMRRLCNYLDSLTPDHPMAKLLPMREHLLIVAALHDTIEDTPLLPNAIEMEFGPAVLRDINWLTNASKDVERREGPNKVCRADRKKMDRDKLKGSPDEIKVLKLIDRWDNLEDMKVPLAYKFATEIYVPESKLLVEDIGGVDPALAQCVIEAGSKI